VDPAATVTGNWEKPPGELFQRHRKKKKKKMPPNGGNYSNQKKTKGGAKKRFIPPRQPRLNSNRPCLFGLPSYAKKKRRTRTP